MTSSVTIEKTEDGSFTLFSSQFNAHYHSIYGAKAESQHVFIEKGLEFWIEHKPNRKSLDILEFGFGSGLNAHLAWHFIQATQLHIQYTGLEAYPLPIRLVKELVSNDDTLNTRIVRLHETAWETPVQLDPSFILIKKKMYFEQLDETDSFDLIFYDSFGPAVQLEHWEPKMLAKTYQALRKGGILVTFCAKGSFKRALRSVGYQVESCPGPPGKREMTRAIK